MPEPDLNNENMEMTIRQQLMHDLREGSWSCRDLSQNLHQTEKTIMDHLEHIRLSLRSHGLTLQIDPAVCRHCGFIFQPRAKLTRPGRCPECRNNEIEPPLYTIKG